MNRLLVFGAVLGFISVIMGALGDHALDLSPEKTKGFDTAIRYNMLYAVLITAFALSQQKALILPGVIFAFSGALFFFQHLCFRFHGHISPDLSHAHRWFGSDGGVDFSFYLCLANKRQQSLGLSGAIFFDLLHMISVRLGVWFVSTMRYLFPAWHQY
ncbi:MAG: DUF423 domain-containing protein [Alphaproteobacteria bacterium]|nr:DUF423 domain-containing protein [Alphaproteobacteria bacterium]